MILLHEHLHDLWNEAKMYMDMYWVGPGMTQVLQCIHEGDNEAASTRLFFLGCLLFFLLWNRGRM